MILVLAGCGASSNDETAAVTQALQHSPRTVLYFRRPIWWGAHVDVRVELVRIRGTWALAKLTARRRTQWAFLVRRERWHVASVRNRKAVNFSCRLAPADVMRELVGGCRYEKPFSDAVFIRGPTRRRAATGAEARAVGCGRAVRISLLDPRYASAHCNYLVYIYTRVDGTWRRGAVASDGARCRSAPPGVARSLFGGCWTG